MRVSDPNARSFYEIESAREMWSVRQLSRQIGSSLYERLALSRNKDEVMRLAQEGQTIEKPADIIKNPITLEFLGLQPEYAYTESKLEHAIIGKMQQFLLELGRGFLFEARQKRFTFDEQHFYVDLVFYNRLLQCYVLIDLKTAKVSHQDLGQMQMYVNYFDRYVKQDFEKPTIGILLCEEKNDALVQLTLPMDALDTDPYVYGCFRNICCEIKRQKYQHGDIIIFGHFISDSKFEFDTVIVVNKNIPCVQVPTNDQYRLASIDPLSPNIPEYFYDGIMYNKDTKYYSFVPCIPACNANGTDAVIANTFKKPILDVYTMFGRKAKNSWYGKTFANEPLTTTSKLDKTWRTIIDAVEKSGLKIGIYIEKIDNEKIF